MPIKQRRPTTDAIPLLTNCLLDTMPVSDSIIAGYAIATLHSLLVRYCTNNAVGIQYKFVRIRF